MKKIMKWIMPILSFAFCALPVFAETGFEFYESILPDNSAVLVVDGHAEQKNEDINIIILNPGRDLEAVDGIANTDYIKYAANLKTDDSGRFYVSVPVDFADDPQGEYKCYVGGAAMSKRSVSSVLYVPNKDTVTGVIEKLKSAQNLETLTQILTENKEKLILNNVLVNHIKMADLAELIWKDRQCLNDENIARAIREINKKIFLTVFNEGQKDLIWKNNQLFYQEIINFEDVDENGGTLFCECFAKVISPEGKNMVIDGLLNKKFVSEAELKTAFAQQVVLTGIKYPNTEGVGHIEKILTKDNAQIAGLDLTEYQKLSTNSAKAKANKTIADGSFSTIEQLQKIVNSAAEAAMKSTPGTSQNGGRGYGESSTKRDNSYSVVLPKNTDAEHEQQQPFSDLSKTEWARTSIEELYKRGIINGVGEKKFAPQNNVTREQFTVMLMRAFDIKPDGGAGHFDDAAEGAYYFDYINTAGRMGIVNGIGDGNFGVGKNLRRQDLAVMIYNISQQRNIVFEVKVNTEFADAEDVSDYAKDAVMNLANAGVINGFDDRTFRPGEICTRAQAAKIIYELMKGVGAL